MGLHAQNFVRAPDDDGVPDAVALVGKNGIPLHEVASRHLAKIILQ